MTPKNHGIMFKTEMIQAYLVGVKTQTRRTKGLDEINKKPNNWELIAVTSEGATFRSLVHQKTKTNWVKLPYGSISSTLYFKETWKMHERQNDGLDQIQYKAGLALVSPDWWEKDEWTRPDPVWAGKFDKWQPSMFMPKICSRFRDIPITRVRVERLQDITEEDAKAEGAKHITPSAIGHPFSPITITGYRAGYKNLWDTINGKSLPWSKNPWVFVYEFPKYQKEQ